MFYYIPVQFGFGSFRLRIRTNYSDTVPAKRFGFFRIWVLYTAYHTSFDSALTEEVHCSVSVVLKRVRCAKYACSVFPSLSLDNFDLSANRMSDRTERIHLPHLALFDTLGIVFSHILKKNSRTM